jgi:ABC-type branched-subunit amino acid transport system substrate-binding protein
MRRVHASLPLTGPAAQAGRDVLRGAELALERTEARIEVIPADSFGSNRARAAVANARQCVDDGDALAYLGDFHSSQVTQTAPILGAASVLQVAPVATFVGLRGPTVVRLMPHDGVGAGAIAEWLVRVGVREVLGVHDEDGDYGTPVAAMCVDAARVSRLAVRTRPVWSHTESPSDDLGDADAVVYVGIAGPGTSHMWRGLHAANPTLWLIGSEGVALAPFAHALDSDTAARTQFFVAQRAPFGFYGYEAMPLIIDAIQAGGDDRAAVSRTARATRDRVSVLGRYSLDDDGHTTNPAYGRMVIVEGQLVWDT